MTTAINVSRVLRRCASVLVLLGPLSACSLPPSRIGLPTPPSTGRPTQTGIASWYGPGFHGKPTASGIIYNQHELTAAHQTLPLGTRVIVTNLENSSSTEVTINDRGPFAKGRVIDLSYAGGQALGMIRPGTIPVRVDVVDSGPHTIQSIPQNLDYTLQIGSFSQIENANQLRERLAKSFADITIVPLQIKHATYYRVQLGTFSNRAAAESQAREVTLQGFPVIIMEK